MAKHASKGQPEALATFAAAERAGGKKPDHVGLEATPDTAPLRRNLEQEQDAATRVLNEAATGKNQRADQAIHDLPDRVMAHRNIKPKA